MKTFILCAAMALAATTTHADPAALAIAKNADPAPCGGVENIADAEFVTNNTGSQVVRPICKRRGLARLFKPAQQTAQAGTAPAGAPVTNAAGGVAPAGAPVTNFIPVIGGLGAALGLGGAAAAVVALNGGDGSTSSTN